MFQNFDYFTSTSPPAGWNQRAIVAIHISDFPQTKLPQTALEDCRLRLSRVSGTTTAGTYTPHHCAPPHSPRSSPVPWISYSGRCRASFNGFRVNSPASFECLWQLSFLCILRTVFQNIAMGHCRTSGRFQLIRLHLLNSIDTL